MKTILLTFLFGIISVSAWAQPGPFDPWLRWETPAYDVHLVALPQDQYIIQGRRFAFDGIGVEVAKADNPLKLFDPFNADTVASSRENVVWDNSNPARAIGFNLFSIHF